MRELLWDRGLICRWRWIDRYVDGSTGVLVKPVGALIGMPGAAVDGSAWALIEDESISTSIGELVDARRVDVL